MTPLYVLAASIAFIVAAIVLLRIHAFFALMLAAILVALAGAPAGPHRLTQAMTDVTVGFGGAVGKIGFTLALAAVIGISLMESGAADKIVRRLIAVCGEERAAVALLIASFLLSAPVFIDTVFMLILPLARALSLRTGRNYLLYVLSIGAGGIITNGTVPPAPGPLYVAESLKLNLGACIVAGAVFGMLPALAGSLCARWFNRRHYLDPRTVPGGSVESLEALASRPESELPGLGAALAPVLLPFFLIAAASTVALFHLGLGPRVRETIEVLGDKNVALIFGALIAVTLHAREKGVPWRKAGALVAGPLETAGLIILIIGAGSAYGEAIRRSGIDHSVRALVGLHSIDYVVLGWVAAVVIRAALGSATVAMITASGIVISVAGPAGFGVHPLYVLLAVGYGSKAMSWMNDTGFWLICRVGGLSQGLALRTWSVVNTAVSVVGLAEVWAVSRLWPHLPF